MYLEHFRLRAHPFALGPDTQFCFESTGFREAMNVLLVALGSGEGYVKITGEVGTGKSLLCRTLLATLGPEFVPCYLPNPLLQPRSLLLAIARELDLAVPARATQLDLMTRLGEALGAHYAAGRRVVVCLDEAQAMPVKTLETLRLLGNLETETGKLLQVVLFGQPELDRLLARGEVRQLRQRIAFSYRLPSLSADEIADYLRHRLVVAGAERGNLFHSSAVRALRRASRGVPRVTNILANKALMAAYGSGQQRVDCRAVRLAVSDTRDLCDLRAQRWSPAWLAAAFSIVFVLSLGITWYAGVVPALAGTP